MVLLCFWLIFIVGPRPIFGYLLVSYGFRMVFIFLFRMFPVDFNRRPSPDLQLSYDFLRFCMVFSWFYYAAGCFLSSALTRSSVISCFPIDLYVFLLVLVCFWLIFIVGPRPIFSYLLISYGFVWFSYGFAMLSVDFHRRPSPDL